MKRIASLLFIVAIVLTACGPITPLSAGTRPSQESIRKPTPESTLETGSNLGIQKDALKGLEITVWYPWYGIESSLFESFVSNFNKKNEWGIKVNAQSQVNFANLYETVNVVLPTKDKPDMVIALPEHALEWNDERVVTDLTPYAQDPVYGIDASDIPSIFWNQDMAGETRVAVPAQRTARFLLWNKTWAGALGFDSPPDTSKDFQQQACRAQQFMLKDGVSQNDFMGGWLVDTEPMTAYAWLLAFGGGAQEGDNYRFLTPNNIEAFKFLRELSESSCAWQTTNIKPIDAFAAREALFIAASLEDLPEVSRAFATANNTDKWTALSFPGTNEDTLVVYGSSYVVLKSTDEKQLASWLFIRWLLENEQDARWVETTHRFPLRESTIGLLADYKKTHPQWAEAIELLSQGKMQPQLASWRKVKVMLGDGFAHMYRVNVASGQVAAILAQMESMSKDLSK